MYRNLFFDVDDTLLDFEAGELKSLQATFEKHHIDYTDKLEKTYLGINAELWRQYEKGTITREQIFINACGNYSSSWPYSAILKPSKRLLHLGQPPSRADSTG